MTAILCGTPGERVDTLLVAPCHVQHLGEAALRRAIRDKLANDLTQLRVVLTGVGISMRAMGHLWGAVREANAAITLVVNEDQYHALHQYGTPWACQWEVEA